LEFGHAPYLGTVLLFRIHTKWPSLVLKWRIPCQVHFGRLALILGFYGAVSRMEVDIPGSGCAYISDASLLGLSSFSLAIAAFILRLIYELASATYAKILTVLSWTSIICFTPYHLLCEAPYRGKFLNVSKYSKKCSRYQHAEESEEGAPFHLIRRFSS